MRKSDAFREYGITSDIYAWSSSGVSENPRQVVLSLWEHAFENDRTLYTSGTAQWPGGGKPQFYKHLHLARDEGLPIRVIIASTDDENEIVLGNASRVENDFTPDFSLVGRVLTIEDDYIELAFDRTGVEPVVDTGRTHAKYWHVADAVKALGKPASIAEIAAWLAEHHPHEDHDNLRYDVAHLTVNDANRRHYDRRRKDWRTDQNKPRDVLFRTGVKKGTRYVLFNPHVHGHWDLRPNTDGKWEAVQLPVSELGEAEAQGRQQAFEHLPPLDSDHDSRVRVMAAIAQRQGQSGFRAMMLDAYGSRCAITGSNAVSVLEAAHIKPYRGEHTHRVDNGLLLRADIHTLFDLGMLWIESGCVVIADDLRGTEYEAYAGQRLRLPKREDQHPNPAHLDQHAGLARKRRGLEP